jgi:enamine deaminase RidA (YjgF/YER057c/UK114 family)
MEIAMELTFKSPPELGAAFAPYSQIAHAKAQEIVFVAGQVATQEDGSIVGVDDFEAQCEQVFKNIETALSHVGANWSNVAQFTSWLISADDIAPYKTWRERKFKELFPSGSYPTNTLLIIQRLVVDTLRLEVQATAVK